MPKIVILCFLIRPKLTHLFIFKKLSIVNNGNVYRENYVIFGMNTDIGHIHILWPKCYNLPLFTRLILMKIIKTLKIMPLANYGRKNMIF